MTVKMKCEIYKSRKKEDTYLYFEKPADFDCLPAELNRSLGELTFVMDLELSPDKKLAREDARKVMENIQQQGFHLQMPPRIESLMAKHNPNA